MTTVRATIVRDLSDEIQSVIKVAETARLAVDLREYVLTDQLAKQFGDVLSTLVASSRPATAATGKTGIWVSGFFGSGKSHFAKLIGHLAANTATSDGPAREVFRTRLRPGNPRHDRIAELLQEADNNGLGARLVAFDITALHGDATENVGRILLRALYWQLGLSSIITFAELELEVDAAGKRDAFLKAYQEASGGSSWEADRDLGYVDEAFARALVAVGHRFTDIDAALNAIDGSRAEYASLTIDGAVKKLLRWLDAQKAAGRPEPMVFFVADEVGAWAGRNLQRIEELRAVAEAFGEQGAGQLWLLATSQERLSDVVQNAGIMDTKVTQEFIQRLQARFGTNVHLEPGEVGTVIEDRVLRKKPASRPTLEALFKDRGPWVLDVAARPGLEVLGEYPAPSAERFVDDYPFLPYQLPLAADIFGGMRGVKVSSGARSMLKVAFDSTVGLADDELGAVVSWDRIFDAANGDNEFADENYLGTPGLQSLEKADQDLAATSPFERPSRIPQGPLAHAADQSCAVHNLQPRAAPGASDRRRHPRPRAARGVNPGAPRQVQLRSPGRGLRAMAIPHSRRGHRREDRHPDRRGHPGQGSARRGRETLRRAPGPSGRRPAWNVADVLRLWGAAQRRSPEARRSAYPAQGLFQSLPMARKIGEEHAAYIEDSAVYWTVPVPDRLDERLRRILAISRLKSDAKFNEIRTAKTDVEAERLVEESRQIERQATEDLHRALGSGKLFWGGEQSPRRAGERRHERPGSFIDRGSRSRSHRAGLSAVRRRRSQVRRAQHRQAVGDAAGQAFGARPSARTVRCRRPHPLRSCPRGCGRRVPERDHQDVRCRPSPALRRAEVRLAGADAALRGGRAVRGWPGHIGRQVRAPPRRPQDARSASGAGFQGVWLDPRRGRGGAARREGGWGHPGSPAGPR